MADAVQTLRANGILMPETMIRAAQLERVELAVAATILMKESGGGRNIYGHDGVPTGGTYAKGGPVTQANYLAYRSWMRGGSGRRQGVGPCQCTSAQYQDTADALGGCWDPLANMRSGFRGMGALIRAYGVQQGARRYNGSGPNAEKYGRDFVARYTPWQRRLSGVSVPTVTVPAPVTTPPASEETDVLVQATPSIDANRYFRAVVKAEVGAGSVFGAAWAFVNATWGDLTEVRVFSQDGKGGNKEFAPTGGRVLNNREFSVPLPSGTRFVTVEGRCSTAATIPTVSAICKPA